MSPIKYPRTFHLPWSESGTTDDKTLSSVVHFHGKEVVVTEKMDGENTTLYSNYIHARSLDSIGGRGRDWVKKFWSTISHDIPQGWRICGENLWARHSISYTNLPSYFMGFSIYNSDNYCLAWDETQEWFSLLGITSVPVIYRGQWNENIIKSIWKDGNNNNREGYVIRIVDSFHYDDFKTSMAKFVRSGHVQTNKHWRHSQIIQNQIKL